MNNIKLIVGRSHQKLGQSVSEKLGISLVKCKLEDFGNTEINVELKENIRECDVYVIQTGSKNNSLSVNDHIMELIAIIDACRRSSAKTISVIIPYYPYSRSDKKNIGRVPIMSATLGSMLDNLGIKRIVSMDLHSAQIQGFVTAPFDNLYAKQIFIKHLNSTYFKNIEDINKNFVLVAPDNGAIGAVESYAKSLNIQFVTMHKHRDYTKKSVVLDSQLIGNISDVVGKTAIIIDDIVDSMGTMVSASNELSNYGIKDIIIIATHGIFSGPAIERINNCKWINKVIVTNTLPQEKNIIDSKKIECVDISSLLANVLRVLIFGGSLSNLFIN